MAMSTLTISCGPPIWTPVDVLCLFTQSYYMQNNTRYALINISGCCPCAVYAFKTHLADAASLTEGADGAHVALVARAEGRGVKGGRVQRDTRVGSHFSGLQMVALAEQGQGVGIDIRWHSSKATHGTSLDDNGLNKSTGYGLFGKEDHDAVFLSKMNTSHSNDSRQDLNC